MKKRGFIVLAIVLIICPWGKAQDKIAFINASVITMTGNEAQNNQTVLISNGKIEKIGSSASLKIPAGYKKVNAKGKYVMPGFIDMHVHFFQEQYESHESTTETELKVMLANGITTARIMAGHPDYLAAKKNVAEAKWIGPSLFVASPQLVGSWPWPPDFKNYEIVDTKEKAAAAVIKFKEQGYDAIKITFMVGRAAYDAIVATAKQEGMKVVGHVGPRVKLPAALAAGEQIEHMDEFIDLLLPDTSYNHGQSVSDMNIWRKPAWATVPFLDESKMPALVKMVKDAGVYVTPTNYFFISSFGQIPPEEEIKQKADYPFIPKSLVEERWKNRKHWIDMQIPQADRDKYIMLRKKMVYELWKAGVPLMAGSDSPEFFLVAGFSLHDELRTFVEAGLTPYAALQTATVNAAKYLGLTNTGQIGVGFTADLLLLDANPLERIENSKSVSAVLKNGVYYSKEAIDKMLNDAKKILN
jgi:predicted amidohydrolase